MGEIEKELCHRCWMPANRIGASVDRKSAWLFVKVRDPNLNKFQL